MCWSNITDAVTEGWQGLDVTRFLIGVGAAAIATVVLWIAPRVVRTISTELSARFHARERTRMRPL